MYGTYSHMASLVKVDILGYYPGIEKKLPYTNSFLKELLFNFYNVSKYVLHIYVHIKRPSQNGYFFSIEKYIKITTIGLNILFIYSPMPALGDHVFFKKLLFISTGPLHEKRLWILVW